MSDPTNHKTFTDLKIKVQEEDDKGVIWGTASTPTPDRMDDIVDPEGAIFKLPLPLLWQHNSREPIGHVVEAKVTKKGITVRAEVPKGLTEEIDKYWKLIKAGLVQNFSIGFRGLDYEAIKDSWGLLYKKWEWLELSAVTIPAQADASISRVKNFGSSRNAGIKSVRLVSFAATGLVGTKDHHPSPGASGAKAVKLIVPERTPK